MRLPTGETAILRALATGFQIKNHRHLDGTKVCHLHDSDGAAVATVSAKDVEQLEKRGLISGNMKFPASAYLLTSRGAEIVASLTPATDRPVSVRFPSAGHSPR